MRMKQFMSQKLDLVNVTDLEQIRKVNLFKIVTVDQKEIYLCDSFTVQDFLGDEYTFMSCAISGNSQTFNNEYVRPMFEFENPNFMFNQYLLGKNLDYALITHYEMQFESEDGLDGLLLATSVWQVYQVSGISTKITLRLRAISDCPNTTIPPRAYYAPEFSSVNS